MIRGDELSPYVNRKASSRERAAPNSSRSERKASLSGTRRGLSAKFDQVAESATTPSKTPKGGHMAMTTSLQQLKPRKLIDETSLTSLTNQQLFPGKIQSPQKNTAPVTTRTVASTSLETIPPSNASTVGQPPKDNVKVVIRVRPINEREKQGSSTKIALGVDQAQKISMDRGGHDQQQFLFDYVADSGVSQGEIFSRIAQPITESCMQGFNGSIFAYGQTGSGKTFTIQGPYQTVNGADQIISAATASGELYEQRGLMQRCFEHMFDMIENEKRVAAESGSEVKYLIKCTYLEIYNEQIMDLLDPSATNLHVREDIKCGVYVEGLQEELVADVNELTALITRGANNRHVGSTKMNKESSRSHSVLTTQIESRTAQASGVWMVKSSQFHIIDLAGSERSKLTQAEGQRLKEAGMINKSLSALGNVINSLVEIGEGRQRHVHYRDSKLTFLLRDSLGGNSKTVIIANVTAAAASWGETLSTLKFAQRAKLIKNKAVINEESSGTIQILKAEIRRLKQEMGEMTTHQQVESVCQLCRVESGQETQDDPADDSLLQDQFVSGISCASTTARNKATSLRVTQLEKLLAANLDNLTSAQKQNAIEADKRHQAMIRMQQAAESLEKQSSRDKMIIRFRDQRIAKMEVAIASESEACKQCQLMGPQMAQLAEERDAWRAECETRSHGQSAKLFAEKAEMAQRISQLESEAKQTPESLTSQVRSLNELTEMLSKYLKEQCEDPQLLSAKTADLHEQLATLRATTEQERLVLTTQLSCIRDDHSQRVKDLQESHVGDLAKLKSEQQTLREQVQSEMEESLKSETQIQQFEFLAKQNTLQMQVYDLREKIEQKDARVNELEQEAGVAREDKEKIFRKLLDTEQLHNNELVTLTSKHREESEELSEDLRRLQKETVHAKTERDELEEATIELKAKLESLRSSEDGLQQQLVEISEAMRESDDQCRNHQREALQWREHAGQLKEKLEEQIANLEGDLALANKLQSTNLKIQSDLQAETKKATDAAAEALSQLQAATEAHTAAHADLKTQMSEMEASHSDVHAQLLEKHKEDCAKTAKTQAALEDYIVEFQNKIVKQQLEDSERHRDELDEVQGDHAAHCAQQEAQHQENLVRQKTTLVSQLQVEQERFQSELATQLQQHTSKELDSRCRISELEASAEASEKLASDVNVRLLSLSSELDRTQSDLRHARTTGEQSEEAISELKHSLTKVQLERDAARSETQLQVEQYDEARRGLETRLSDLERSKSQVAGALSAKNTDLQLLQQRMVTQETQMSAENQNLRNQVRAKDLECTQWQQKCEEAYFAQKESLSTLQADHRSTLDELAQQHEIFCQTAVSATENSLVKRHAEDKQAFGEQKDQKARHYLLLQQAAHQEQLVGILEQVRMLNEWRRSIQQQVAKGWSFDAVAPDRTQLLNYVKLFAERHNGLVSNLSGVQTVHQKELEAAHSAQAGAKQELLQHQEQLLEYKGLLAQLQQEKQQSLKKLVACEARVAASCVEATRCAQESEERIQQLETAHASALQEVAAAKEALLGELTRVRSQLAEASTELSKQKAKSVSLATSLKQAKDTVSQLMEKENSLVDGVKGKMDELSAQHDKWKAKVHEQRLEISELRREKDLTRSSAGHTAENHQSLLRLKDAEIANHVSKLKQTMGETDELRGQFKQVQTTLAKRENELKELVRTLRTFADEKRALEVEVSDLRRENEVYAGHSNQHQKIQHHMKIKEENNRLKQELHVAQAELKRKGDVPVKTAPQQTAGESRDLQQMRRDCVILFELLEKLVEQVCAMPGAASLLSKDQRMKDSLKRVVPSSSTHATQLAAQKAKSASEVILNCSRQLQIQIRQQNEQFQRQQQQQRTGSSSYSRQQTAVQQPPPTSMMPQNPNITRSTTQLLPNSYQKAVPFDPYAQKQNFL